MTNRDYLMTLDNKKLAAFIRSGSGGENYEICASMKKCYPTCQKCVEKWLEKNINKWIDYEDVTGEGSNTYECPYCDFVLQLMEGTPEENLYNYCPRCGKKLIIKN